MDTPNSKGLRIINKDSLDNNCSYRIETTVTVRIACADVFMPLGCADWSVLYFSRHEEEFIVSLNTSEDREIAPIVERLEKRTGYTWDKKVLKGSEHDALLEESQARMGEHFDS